MTDPKPTPAQAETEGGTVEVEWLGHTIELPASTDDWDINAVRAMKTGDAIGVIENLLPPDEFARIEKTHRSAHAGRFLVRDLKPLGDQIAELYGFGSAGE